MKIPREIELKQVELVAAGKKYKEIIQSLTKSSAKENALSYFDASAFWAGLAFTQDDSVYELNKDSPKRE